MLYPCPSRSALGAIRLTTRSVKGGSTDDTLGEWAIQALVLGGYLHADMRRWLKTLASVELANRGLSDEAIYSIGAAIEMSSVTDPESGDRQMDVIFATREALRSFALSLRAVDFARIHFGALLTTDQIRALPRVELN